MSMSALDSRASAYDAAFYAALFARLPPFDMPWRSLLYSLVERHRRSCVDKHVFSPFRDGGLLREAAAQLECEWILLRSHADDELECEILCRRIHAALGETTGKVELLSRIDQEHWKRL